MPGPEVIVTRVGIVGGGPAGLMLSWSDPRQADASFCVVSIFSTSAGLRLSSRLWRRRGL